MTNTNTEQNKKKILYVITKSNWGGAQRYVFDLATALSREKYDVHVALGGKGLLASKLEAEGVAVHYCPSLERDVHILKEVRAFKELFLIVKKIHPDTLHLNSPKAAGLGGLVGRLLGIKNIIVTSHGWAFWEERSRLERFFIQCATWATIILSHHIIAVSKRDMRAITGLLGMAHKVTHIGNGILETKLLERTVAREELCRNKTETKETLWVGTVAELHRNKGLADGVRAISLLIRGVHTPPPFIWIIIGDGEERHALQELIKENDLSSHVILVGVKERAETFMSAFDIFLLPSRKEGLPYTLLEAGIAGVPAIATNVGGIPDIIHDMENSILLKHRRPKEIAEALRFLLSHPLERERFGKNFRQTIRDKCSFDHMVAATRNLY